MKNIKKLSRKFIKSIRYNLNWINVQHYCKTIGFETYVFDENDAEFINSLGISFDDVKDKEGFIYDYEDCNFRYIFVNDKLDEFNKIDVLLHELGHIILNHKLSMMRNEVQEREADEFAMQVMQNCNNQLSFTKISLISACIFFIVIAALYDKDNKNINAVAPTEESIVETESLINDNMIKSDTVLITKTGECYHASDCYTIKNKNTISISFYEAQKSYRPCKVCIK